jgi:ATP-dependent Clp protease ATP-binding subunit ClpC
MTVTRLEDGADAIRLGVSGLGAYTILAPEAGLHLLEHGSGEGRSERVSVLVTVEPVPWGSDGPVAEPGSGGAPAVVRRYRDEPSPLVRDGVRGWRTGRLDRVLAGDFDVL